MSPPPSGKRRTRAPRRSAPAPGAGARWQSARALLEVLDHGRSLGDALGALEESLPDGRDRALTRRRCNRVLRDLPALEWRLNQLLDRPLPRKARDVHFLLLGSLDELIEGREPAHAILHASVAAARTGGRQGFSGLVNAVLRGWQRSGAAIEPQLPSDAATRFGYPVWLIDALRADWPGNWQDIATAGNQPPPLWLRVNRRRASPESVAAALDAAGVQSAADPRFPDALRPDHGARVSALPGFADGEFSIQDAGAQAAADLLALEDGQRVLDACAAPGGKSAHILERADVALTALELDPVRAERIEAGLKRLGLRAEVRVGDAARPDDWWDGQAFDRILIDAPCSATGVLRRHPDVRWLRRPTDIAANVEAQRAIFEALWPLLRPGGLLVYATCSILHAENRDRIRRFLEQHDDARVEARMPVDATELAPGAQILPGSLDRDGFYYAVLRRLPA